jgi:type IV pilus assembly protein PilE
MKSNSRAGQKGLTLVELMIVVAVMAVIAAVAYPLYTSQTQKARRADAKIALESLAMAQERYFTINGSYASASELDDPDGDGSDTDSVIDPIIAKLDRNGDGAPDNYAIAVTNTTVSFTVTATAQGAQAGDTACSSFTINQAGTRAASADKCW